MIHAQIGVVDAAIEHDNHSNRFDILLGNINGE